MTDPASAAPLAAAAPPLPSPRQARLVAAAEVLLCSSIPTQFAIGAVLALAGVPALGADGRLSLPFVFTLSVADTVVLIGLMVLILKMHGEDPRALWLGSRPVGREVVRGLLLVPVVFLMVVVLLNALKMGAPWLHNVEVNPLEQLASTPGEAAMFAAVAIFAGGLREELQRAFLLSRFERHLGGTLVGAVLLSVAFGLGHFVQGWDAVFTTGALGLFWAVLYLRRRSSIAPVVSHAGFNSLEILRVALVGV